MNHRDSQNWDEHRDRAGQGADAVPPSQDPEQQRLWHAESQWLDALADDTRQPLDDADTFTAGVLTRWQRPVEPGAETEREKATPAPLSIRRWSAFAAALVLAGAVGYVAGLQTAEYRQPQATEPPRRQQSLADATQSDPLGTLMQDIGRQIEQRPDQFRRALHTATVWLGGRPDAETAPADSAPAGNGADDRSS